VYISWGSNDLKIGLARARFSLVGAQLRHCASSAVKAPAGGHFSDLMPCFNGSLAICGSTV
jgi:hypothetical protein